MGLSSFLYLVRQGYYDPRSSDNGNLEEKEIFDNLVKYSNLGNLLCLGEDDHRVFEFRIKIAQWRKAYHIHQYFVENCAYGKNNNSPICTSLGSLRELKDRCEIVIRNPEKAMEFLPSSPNHYCGFGYDDYYFESLKFTVDVIDKILTEFDEEKHYQCWIQYEESW